MISQYTQFQTLKKFRHSDQTLSREPCNVRHATMTKTKQTKQNRTKLSERNKGMKAARALKEGQKETKTERKKERNKQTNQPTNKPRNKQTNKQTNKHAISRMRTSPTAPTVVRLLIPQDLLKISISVQLVIKTFSALDSVLCSDSDRNIMTGSF